MTSKKIIRCKKCEDRVVKHTIGFIKSDELHCTRFDISVDKNDGCTFGKEGDPIHKVVSDTKVYI